MISIVVPIYKSEFNIPDLITQLNSVVDYYSEEVEVVFVIDGSPDRSFDLLQSKDIIKKFKSQLILLSRNFGALSAVQTGLFNARGRVIVVKAADCQEPVILLTNLVDEIVNDRADISIGVRETREDNVKTRIFSAIYWAIFRRLGNDDVPRRGVDIFAISKSVRDQIIVIDDNPAALVGLLYWVGFRRVEIGYDRIERKIGKSSWSFRKKAKYAIDSLTSFSGAPLVWLAVLGVVSAVISVALSVTVMFRQLIWHQSPPGYTPIVLGIGVLMSSMMFGFAVLGAYVWRIAEDTRGRPSSIIAARLELDSNMGQS